MASIPLARFVTTRFDLDGYHTVYFGCLICTQSSRLGHSSSTAVTATTTAGTTKTVTTSEYYYYYYYVIIVIVVVLNLGFY